MRPVSRHTHRVILLVGFLGLVVLASALRQWNDAMAWQHALSIPVSGIPNGTAQLIQGLWIARQPSGEFYVFLNRDPHGGHPFDWIPQEGVFRSPKLGGANGPHDEVYRIDGTCKANNCNTSPPMGLHRVATRLTGDDLLVLRQRVVSGGVPPAAWWREVFLRLQEWR